MYFYVLSLTLMRCCDKIIYRFFDCDKQENIEIKELMLLGGKYE